MNEWVAPTMTMKTKRQDDLNEMLSNRAGLLLVRIMGIPMLSFLALVTKWVMSSKEGIPLV